MAMKKERHETGHSKKTESIDFRVNTEIWISKKSFSTRQLIPSIRRLPIRLHDAKHIPTFSFD